MNKSVESLTAEISGRLDLLERNLPRRIDGYALCAASKLPFKALGHREALAWRMAELSRAAFGHFQDGKVVAAILMTRGAVETTAALWFLRARLETTIRSGAVGNIDDYLMKLVMGGRVDQDILLPAINVLNFVDSVEKDLEGFRQQYDRLSEFAHPNWAGTTGHFARPDPPNAAMDFGANIRGAGSAKAIGLSNLSVALMLFENSYNRVADLMPDFVRLCGGRTTAPADSA